MPHLLVVKSSLNGDNGKSNQLVAEFVSKWQAKNAGGAVTVRDLAADALPHLTQAEMGAWAVAEGERTAEQKELAKRSDDLIAELKAADVVAIGMPMYNYAIPSTFKAWIDHIARAGVTFTYSATGPTPLLDAKKVFVLCARGGVYTPETDSQTPYLKTILGFLGQNPTFVYAEGMMMTDKAAASLEAAKAKIAELA